MLVLSRRVGESVCLGPDIEVQITGIDRGQVRIAFKAPDSVCIYRKELMDRKGFDPSVKRKNREGQSQ